MSERVTIAQVAEEAGVSAMTVSNVLNGRSGASEETRRRVLSAAERLGYQPNLSARNLKAGRTELIGVMTLDLTGQYGLEIVRGIADELASDEREMPSAPRTRMRCASGAGGVPGPRAGGRRADGRARPRVRHHGTAAPQAPALRGDRPSAHRYPAAEGHGRQLRRDAAGNRAPAGSRPHPDRRLRGDADLESSTVRYQGFHNALRLAGVDVDERMVVESDFSYTQSFRVAPR